ncbi:MAG TPA: 30S ribosomal protein S18 [Mycobacterium sp.]|nr:30S ribosomal protein S18 [Mycobacterium sp.]
MAKKSKPTRRTPATETKSAKRNLLKTLRVNAVDYKDTNRLRMFISDRGKIRSRRVTGLTVQQQRQVAIAIKNSREMALLPYTSGGS